VPCSFFQKLKRKNRCLFAGTALTFEESGGGGQLGQGNDFDRWEPQPVRQLHMGRAGVHMQYSPDGHKLWRILQVSCGLNHTVVLAEISDDVEM